MRGRCLDLRVLLVPLCFCANEIGWATSSQSSSADTGSADVPAIITLESGTKIELALIVPVWAKAAKPGDPIYTQTNFPVVGNPGIAIPAGTWVQGKIESVTKPTRKSSRAELQILFQKIIFANGYSIALPDIAPASQSAQTAVPSSAMSNAASTAIVTDVTVEASPANDLLLDNGAQVEITLAAPLVLDATKVANALPLSHPPEPGKFKSATLCRPTPGEPGTPGTPGSPDTVIPGSPGTPSITIPGGPGMPDTVIPGTPATPDTVIPGSPGTPGTPGTPGIVCPAAPIVISSVPVAPTPAKNEGSVPQMTH
jgi:hypothetical protein